MTWSSSMSSGYSSLEEEESEEFFFTARTSFFRRPPGKTRAAPQVSAGLHVAPRSPCPRLGAALCCPPLRVRGAFWRLAASPAGGEGPPPPYGDLV